MVRARFALRGVPIVTYTLMFLNIAIFVVGLAFGGNLGNTPGDILVYRATGMFASASNPIYSFGMEQGLLIQHDPIQIYRILTAMFLQANITHIAFNMLSLLFVGVVVERVFGSGRFAHHLLRIGHRRRTATGVCHSGLDCAGRLRGDLRHLRRVWRIPVDAASLAWASGELDDRAMGVLAGA